MTISIYVGMALSDAPEEFTGAFQDDLKAGLRALSGVEVLDFYWKAVTPNPAQEEDTEVYIWDRERTVAAGLCVFIGEYASTGMGQELEIRGHSGKFAIGFVRRGVRASRMFTGGCKKYNYPLVEYDSAADIVAAVASWIQEQNTASN